jgi:adsorption protein B
MLDGALAGASMAARELSLFAAVGFVLFGIDDLLVDLIWIGRTLWRRVTVYTRHRRSDAATLPPPLAPGRFAVFIPAWDESDVIGGMLALTLERWRGANCDLFVGCYPNDPSTVGVVRAFGRRDARVRPVIAPRPGPTTKADCLNALYRAMTGVEADTGVPYKGVVLHDAEDVVHPDEIRVFDVMLERAGLVQLPVLPLIDAASRWIAGHYLDEFAESHGKELVVREAIGAAVPLAGVACAIRRDIVAALAGEDGEPFDRTSLTEDYEIGLRLADLGARGMFVRLPAARGRTVVMTREHFPATLRTAVRQKSRWMLGIALAGWDRLGWRGGVAERWMRLRDRKSVLAALFVLAAYAGGLLWTASWMGHQVLGSSLVPPSATLEALIGVNLLLFAWRLLIRFSFVTAAYGIVEGVSSIPRVFVANLVAVLAARAALSAYLLSRRTGETKWDKTRHVFPSAVPAE